MIMISPKVAMQHHEVDVAGKRIFMRVDFNVPQECRQNSIYLSVHLSICLSVYLSINLSIDLSIYGYIRTVYTMIITDIYICTYVDT